MKAFRIFIIAAPVSIVLWIVGLLNDLKLIPVMEEDYYIGSAGLRHEMTLMENEEEFTLQMPRQYDEVKPIDLTINPPKGKHLLTISRMSAKVILPDGSTDPMKFFYVFSGAGELPGIEQVSNYPVGLTDDDSVSAYVQVRSVYELKGIDEFRIQVDADYTYDNKNRTFSKTFDVVHTSRLRWRGLEIKGDH